MSKSKDVISDSERLNSDPAIRRVLERIDRALIKSPALEDIFHEFDLAVHELFQHHRIVISLYVHHRHRVEHSYVSGAPIKGLEQGVLHYISREAAKIWFAKQKAFRTHSDDVPARDDLEVFDAAARAAGLNSWLMAPIHWQGEPVGSLMLRSSETDAYTDHDLEVADLLTSKIAAVVANAHDVSELRFESGLREALLELSRLISSVRSLEEIQDEFGAIACSLINADRVAIAVPNMQDQALENLLVYGHSLESYETGSLTRPVEFTGIPWLNTENPYIVDADTTQISPATAAAEDIARKSGLYSTLVAPVSWLGEPIAAITFRARDKNAFDYLHTEIADAIAKQVAGAIANQIGYQKAERESQTRDLLAQISRVIASSQNLDATFDEMGELLSQLVPSHRLVVTLLSESDQPPQRIYEYGLPLIDPETGITRIASGNVERFLAQIPAPIIITPDSPEIPEKIGLIDQHAIDAGFKSWMVAPMMWRNELLGLIHFRSTIQNAYGLSELDIAEQAANQIAGAIAGNLAYENRVREAGEREALAKISRIVTSGESLDETFDQFFEIVGGLIPIDRLSMTRYIGGKDQPFSELDYGRAFTKYDPEDLPPIQGEISDILRQSKQPVIFSENMPDAPEVVLAVSALAKAAGLNSWLAAPMFWRNNLIGNIHFRSEKENAYEGREIRLAGEIASQVAGAVAGSIAYEQMESEAKIREVLAEISRMIGSSNTYITVLPKLRTLTKSIVEFDGFSIGTFDTETQRFRDFFSRGVFKTGMQLAEEFPISESVASEAITSGTVICTNVTSINQLTGRPRTIEAFKAGTRSFITAPLISNDTTIGAIQLRSTTVNTYGEDQAVIVQRIANQIAGGFANLLANEQIRLQAAALESADNAIVITTPDGIIEWTNSAFTRLSGWSTTEVVGQHTSIMNSADPTNRPINDQIWAALRNGNSWSGVHINRKKDGAEYPEDLTVTPVFNQDGTVIHLTGIKQDISDRIRAELEHEDAIRIESENRELQRLAAARSEFLSVVSHELRTPLTTVSAFADILFNINSDNLTDNQRQHVSLIRKSSKHLSSLINDLLDVSQADSGRLILDKADFELSAMIDEVVETSRVLLSGRNQLLELSNETSALTLHADRSRLIQVLSNLLTNASKFSDKGSTITLAINAESDLVAFSISDQGPGISDVDKAMMFSPFYRGTNPETIHAVGSGLGLAVVNSLVELHDGEITVLSEIGEGTTITIKLPGVVSGSTSN